MWRGALSLVALTLAGAVPEAGAAAPYDFNNDGYEELVAGLPHLAEGSAEAAGGIVIVPGSRRGIALAHRQLITQATDGVPDDAEEDDNFGGAVASADFDADGHADLAVASGERRTEDPRAGGAVTVLYGSDAGLTGIRSAQLTDRGELNDPSDEFGETSFAEELAAGDIDKDGFADLIVGTSANYDYRDRVAIIHGGPTGLTPDRMRWLLNPYRVREERNSALALGDVNRDGYLDIVEGEEGNALDYGGTGESGYLTYCPGTPAGPIRCDRVEGYKAPRRGAASLAIGDVTGDGFPDIVAGMPDDRFYWPHLARRGAGVVVVLRGTPWGPAVKPFVISQETRGVPGRSTPGDRFGHAVVVGRIDGDRYADIVIGANGESRVTVLRGGRRGVRPRGGSAFGRTLRGMAPAGRIFGSAVSLLDHNGDRRLDMTVGSAGISPDDSFYWHRGTVVTLRGRRGGFRMTGASRVDASVLGLRPGAATALGWILGR